MSNKIDPVFKLSNLTAEELLEVTIDEASEGRSFGRRFKVNAGASGSSEALLFRDILDEVKDIAKTAKKNRDLKKFEAVSKLLVTLNTADGDANLLYEEKGCGYRSLTFISRLFRQAHSKRIIKLQKSVSKNIDALDPMKRLADLKNLPDNSLGKSMESEKLAKEFFDNKDYDHCLEAIKETPYPGTVEIDFISEIAENYLTNDEPEKALETIQLIKDHLNTKKNAFIAKVADYYFIREKFDKVFETMKLSSMQNDIDISLKKIAEFYFTHEEYEKAAETINLVQSLIYLPTILIKNILDKYIDDKKYEKALELLPALRDRTLDYAVKIGNLCCDDNDFENAHKAIELIHKQGDLYPKEKQASEALIKRVVTHYCESGEPDIALQIVDPMSVASSVDLSTKNALLKEIANTFISTGQLDEALTTHDKILPKFKLDNAFFMKAAEAYFAKNEPQRALLTIGKCGGLQFRDGIAILIQKYQDAINQ